MNDNKKKTRSELLRELESIKGLLGEEQDIPILQEIFAPEPEPAGTTGESRSPADSLKREELAALKSAYQSLLADAEHFAESDDGDIGSETLSAPSRPSTNHAANPRPAPSQTTGSASKVLPGQQSLFGSDREKQQALLSSYGENPFLPQHIRARLRGNRPEASDTQNASTASQQTAPGTTPQSRDTLINDLVQQVMPQLEQRLRDQLQRMSADEIKALLKEK